MNISDEHIAAVESLGYTRDEARFLYLVATHSGYFVPRQFLTFAGAKWGKRSDHFLGKLESRGHVTWREYPSVGGVYRLFSKTLYRAIDKENLRNCRRHSTEFIRTRLVVLDFVLRNQAYHYLETENDKVSYFTETLGIPRIALPVKAYRASSAFDPTLRYFVDKFPLFLDGSGDGSDVRLTCCYVDAGEASLARFRHHLDNYRQLLLNLSDFHFLYVSNSAVHFAAAERCFSAFANRALHHDPSAELLRYFTLRARWDKKQYGTLSNDEVEWLNRANVRFRKPETEHLYAAWCAGELPSDCAATRLVDACRPRQFHFTTCLVSAVQTTSKRKHITQDREEDMARIKKPPESVERQIRLEEPISQLLDDYCQFVDCTPDYVTNFVLRKILSRDPDYRKWKTSQPAASTGKAVAVSSPGARNP